MSDNNYVHALPAKVCNLLLSRTAIIHRNDQVELPDNTCFEKSTVRAVAVCDAVRNDIFDFLRSAAECIRQQYSARYAVSIEISVDQNTFTICDRFLYPCFGLLHSPNHRRFIGVRMTDAVQLLDICLA